MSQEAEAFQQAYLSTYRDPATKLAPEAFAQAHGDAFLVYFGASSELRAPVKAWQSTVFDDGRKAGGDANQRSVGVQIFPVKYSGRSMSPRWVTVGRAERTNDIPIVDESVSASHAVFERGSKGEFLLRDATSRAGTFVNDEPVDAETAHPLKSGDSLRFGAVNVVFLMAPEFIVLVKSMS